MPVSESSAFSARRRVVFSGLEGDWPTVCQTTAASVLTERILLARLWMVLFGISGSYPRIPFQILRQMKSKVLIFHSFALLLAISIFGINSSANHQRTSTKLSQRCTVIRRSRNQRSKHATGPACATVSPNRILRWYSPTKYHPLTVHVTNTEKYHVHPLTLRNLNICCLWPLHLI